MVFNSITREMEKQIKECFSNQKSIVSNIPSEDLFPMMKGWLKTNIHSANYDIHIIEMVMAATGISISVKIDGVNDYNLRKCMRVLGCPKDVYIGDDKNLYAHWTRNVISWF